MEFSVGESRLLAGSWAVARLPRTVAAWGWCVEVVKAGEVGVGVVGVVDAQLAEMAVLVAGAVGWLAVTAGTGLATGAAVAGGDVGAGFGNRAAWISFISAKTALTLACRQ